MATVVSVVRRARTSRETKPSTANFSVAGPLLQREPQWYRRCLVAGVNLTGQRSRVEQNGATANSMTRRPCSVTSGRRGTHQKKYDAN